LFDLLEGPLGSITKNILPDFSFRINTHKEFT